MFFTFPEDAGWNAERQAVEFGVEIGEYHGSGRVPRPFQRLLPAAHPERVEVYYAIPARSRASPSGSCAGRPVD
jgi:hypothetical protein